MLFHAQLVHVISVQIEHVSKRRGLQIHIELSRDAVAQLDRFLLPAHIWGCVFKLGPGQQQVTQK